MTLAIHGKSRRRQGILVLVAFIAVLGAILAGSLAHGRAAEAITPAPAGTVKVCKYYEPTGPIDTAESFPVHVDQRDPITNAQITTTGTALVVGEGDTDCTSEIAITPGAKVIVSEDEFPGWKQYAVLSVGNVDAPLTPGFELEFVDVGQCEDVPCVVTFTNKAPETSTDSVEGENSILVCKYFEQSGPVDDFGRTFNFSLYIDEEPLGNADTIVDFSITVDEGQSNCTDAFEIPAEATVGVQEIGSPGFTNAPGYPMYQLIQYGQEQASGQETIFFFNNENDCQAETPCVVNFFNRADDGPAEFPIRICKTHIDNGDGYARPDTTFTFDANWTQTTITVAEGETECVIVYTEPESIGNTITVSEHMLPGFEQAPGFMKRKIDSYPAQSTPDMGPHAGAIIMKIDDGCYEPYGGPIEGGASLVRQALTVVLQETTEPFICTVYFFNKEVPNDGPDCEVNCEPECEVDCTEPECEIDCDDPQCEINCDPPVCLFDNCDPPCTPNCGEPQCEANCDDSTPTPTPDIPETPTAPSHPQTQPEPEEDVEGEITPGPQATPKAPDTGSSLATPGRSSAPMFLVMSIGLVAASLAAGVMGIALRRN